MPGGHSHLASRLIARHTALVTPAGNRLVTYRQRVIASWGSISGSWVGRAAAWRPRSGQDADAGADHRVAARAASRPARRCQPSLIDPRPAPFTGGRPELVRAGHGRWRPLVNSGQQCWKACWGQPLRSSNLLSSATLICDDANMVREPNTHQGYSPGLNSGLNCPRSPSRLRSQQPLLCLVTDAMDGSEQMPTRRRGVRCAKTLRSARPLDMFTDCDSRRRYGRDWAAIRCAGPWRSWCGLPRWPGRARR